MSVTNTPRKAGPYTGNNVAVQFTFAFKVFADTDLVVTRALISTGAETTLALTTDYTVFRNADQDTAPGGYVTLVTPLASTHTLTLTSAVPDVQPAVFTNLGGFFPAVLNTALDRLTILVQQLKEIVSRSLKLAVSTPTGFDATLPAPVPYAGIVFNGDGTGFATGDTAASGASALAGDLAADDGATLIGYAPGVTVSEAVADLEADVTAINASQAADLIGHYARQLYDGTAVGIDCFGDSTMWGDNGGTGVQAGTTQPSRLQFLLRAYYANTAATVVNRAISGTDTQQMLDGTDGSGSTFEARIAATTSKVIYCNHCINDVNGGRTGAAFKANWLRIIRIIRSHGKSPVIVTPSPMLVNANATFDANAEKLRQFVNIMKQVAQEQAVPLVDQYDLVTRYIRSGDQSVALLIPDGEHPAEALYKQMGNNLALPFLGNQVLPDIEGFLPAFLPQFESTGTAGAKAIQQPQSRVGGARWTDSSGTQTIRLAVYVPEGGCDLYLAQMLWDQGATAGAVAVDFVSVGTLSWYQNVAYTSTFAQDYEVCIARNVPPGLHYVECSNVGSGKLGVNYLRVRESTRPKSLKGTGNTTTTLPTLLRSVRMMDRITYQSQSATDSSIVLFDELPSRGLFEEHVVEVDAALAVNQYVVLRGSGTSSAHTLSGASNPRAHLVVGLNASGYLTCLEFTPTAVTTTVFDAVNRAGVSNLYRFETYNGTLKVYVAGTQIGATLTLQEPGLKGGNVGLYTLNVLSLVTINSISYVYTV